MNISGCFWGRYADDMINEIPKIAEHFNEIRLSFWIYGLRDYISTLKDLQQKYNLKYNFHMSWGEIDLSSRVENIRQASIKEAKDAIDILFELKGGVLNFHFSLKPLFYKFYSEKEKETNLQNELKSFKEIVAYAKDKNVIITVENSSKSPSSRDFVEACDFSFQEIFINEISDAHFGLNIDIGHFNHQAHLMKLDLKTIFRKFGHRIKYVHAHDNDGTSDQHKQVGTGNINWVFFLDLLNEYDFDGTLELELASLDAQIKSKQFLLDLRPNYFNP